MTTPMSGITLNALRKSYGAGDILHGIDLTVAAGEFLVLLGPSGCGKSTLLRMVAGLERVTAGEIAIGGRVVNDLEPRERGCAMVFQNYALYPHMTVAENIGYALRIGGMRKAERMARVRAVAASLGLEPYLDRRPGQLSGGQRQRVAMGRAMIRAPQVFLYDEPLSNLDARLRVAMRVEIRNLHKRLGTTTLFVTHDQIEAMTLADRVAVMNGGRIEQLGTPAEIYRRPRTPFVAEFIGTPGMNLIPVEADPDRTVLAFDNGGTMRFDPRQWPDVPRGPLLCGIRAEEIRLTVAGAGIAARVDFIEELGPARLVHCDLAGARVAVHLTGDDVPAPGATVALQAAPDALHLFDPAAGRRLPEILHPARARMAHATA